MTDPAGNTWDHELMELKVSSSGVRCYANCSDPIAFVGMYNHKVKGRTRRERRFMCPSHAEKWKAKYEPKII